MFSFSLFVINGLHTHTPAPTHTHTQRDACIWNNINTQSHLPTGPLTIQDKSEKNIRGWRCSINKHNSQLSRTISVFWFVCVWKKDVLHEVLSLFIPIHPILVCPSLVSLYSSLNSMGIFCVSWHDPGSPSFARFTLFPRSIFFLIPSRFDNNMLRLLLYRIYLFIYLFIYRLHSERGLKVVSTLPP